MTNWQIDAFVRELRRLWPDTHETAGWRTRSNRTSFIAGGPIGTVNHHTVSGSDNGAVNTITNGWPGVSGPIYNVLVLSTGAVHLIAAGPANHAGQGAGAVRDRIRAGGPPGPRAPDTMNGNQSFLGIAARHVGTNPNYPARQIDAIVAVNAAFCLARGWPNGNRCMHHREWSGRKIDMSWTGDLRGRVTAAMRGAGAAPTPPPPAPPRPPSGSWFDMATEAQLRAIVREEIRAAVPTIVQATWNETMPAFVGVDTRTGVEAQSPGQAARSYLSGLMTMGQRTLGRLTPR